MRDEKFIRLLLNLKLVNEFEIQECILKLRRYHTNLNATNEFKVIS